MTNFVVIDFETSDLQYYRKGFEVISCAFTDGVRTWSAFGSARIDEEFSKLDRGAVLVAHNMQFDYGVLSVHFPKHKHFALVDTMRLVQVYDNGGASAPTVGYGEMSLEDQIMWLSGVTQQNRSGLGLQSAVSRMLPPELHNHKEKFYKWLRDNKGVKKGEEGKNLSQLPTDLLKEYNEADVKITWELLQFLLSEFKSAQYDWQFDHLLHIGAIRRITAAHIRGIKVDRSKVAASIESIERTTLNTVEKFQEKFAQDIEHIENKRREEWIAEAKSERGQNTRRSAPLPEVLKFNTRSNTQLKMLFVDHLGIKPTFWTKPAKGRSKEDYTPSPSFRSVHLPTYGEGGQMLASLKKLHLVKTQLTSLQQLAEGDGRWHQELRACGTKTGRYTGSGSGPVRLNIQALARRDEGLMSTLIADEGLVFVSVDLSAGEPTLVAHYSGDETYKALCFEMVGKEPYWNKDKVLILDDPYLSFASISPLGSKVIRDAWDQGMFAGWVADQEQVKKKLKTVRALHKTLFLALLYGQGPAGMVAFASDQGAALTVSTAREIHTRFWKVLFPKVDRLSSQLQAMFKRDGYLVNEFGYRMKPEQARLSLNYFIQSGVSGVMKVFEEKLFAAAPYAQYVSTVHDETLMQVPISKVDEFREVVRLATESLNRDLNWSVSIRTGFVTGRSLYEAK